MPSEKRVVYDVEGNRVEAFPVDAEEIIAAGGSYDAPKTKKGDKGFIERIPIDPQAGNATEAVDAETGEPVVVEGTVTAPLTENQLRGRTDSGASIADAKDAKDAKKK